MALGIFLTTTGTLDPVVIDDMGGRTFPHPTVDYNLLHDVSEDEIQSSTDLQKLIDDGHVILKDDQGDIITDVQAAGPHKHPAADIEDFDTAVSANTDVAANTADRHAHANKALLDTYDQTNADLSDAVSKKHDRQHVVTDTNDHEFPAVPAGKYLKDDGT